MLTSPVVQLLVIVAAALIIWFVTERFSPDPLITKIVQILVFVGVIIAVLLKFLPLLGFHV